VGHELEEGRSDRARVVEDQGPLAEVAEDAGWKDEQQPGPRYFRPPEVTHVGVEGLNAGERQNDGGQGEEPRLPSVKQEVESVGRGERLEHRGMQHDSADAQCRDRQEPDEHDRAE
jgi:hypothetical protein